MNYFYKTGLSSIDYYSTEQKITLRDEHDVVRIARAPFERIIKAWRDGRPTCWNASGTAPGWRLYDEGIIIECYEEDNLRFVWFPEDDWEEIIQAYNKFTKHNKVESSYGRILPNGDFLWYNFMLVPCPHSVMAALSATASFVQLTIDDWTFVLRNDTVFVYYKQEDIFELSVKEFLAAIIYWRKETQN
jgi:hypothetical protein